VALVIDAFERGDPLTHLLLCRVSDCDFVSFYDNVLALHMTVNHPQVPPPTVGIPEKGEVVPANQKPSKKYSLSKTHESNVSLDLMEDGRVEKSKKRRTKSKNDDSRRNKSESVGLVSQGQMVSEEVRSVTLSEMNQMDVGGLSKESNTALNAKNLASRLNSTPILSRMEYEPVRDMTPKLKLYTPKWASNPLTPELTKNLAESSPLHAVSSNSDTVVLGCDRPLSNFGTDSSVTNSVQGSHASRFPGIERISEGRANESPSHALTPKLSASHSSGQTAMNLPPNYSHHSGDVSLSFSSFNSLPLNNTHNNVPPAALNSLSPNLTLYSSTINFGKSTQIAAVPSVSTEGTVRRKHSTPKVSNKSERKKKKLDPVVSSNSESVTLSSSSPLVDQDLADISTARAKEFDLDRERSVAATAIDVEPPSVSGEDAASLCERDTSFPSPSRHTSSPSSTTLSSTTMSSSTSLTQINNSVGAKARGGGKVSRGARGSGIRGGKVRRKSAFGFSSSSDPADNSTSSNRDAATAGASTSFENNSMLADNKYTIDGKPLKRPRSKKYAREYPTRYECTHCTYRAGMVNDLKIHLVSKHVSLTGSFHCIDRRARELRKRQTVCSHFYYLLLLFY